MKAYILIGKMYDNHQYTEEKIISVFIDEQKANDKIAELSEILNEHQKKSPSFGMNLIELYGDDDDLMEEQLNEYWAINPFKDIDDGNNIEEFFIKEYEII
jgi:antirestriction protein